MADLVDHFADFADSLLRPRAFSERRLAPDGFAALKAALAYALAAIGLFLVGASAGSRAIASRTMEMLEQVVLLPTIPMAVLLYVLQEDVASIFCNVWLFLC
jgi:hypothetical protein